MSINSSRFYLYKRSNHIYYIGYHQNDRLRWKSTGATTDQPPVVVHFG